MNRRMLIAALGGALLWGAAGHAPATAATTASGISWTVDNKAKTITALVRLQIYSGCSGDPKSPAEARGRACAGPGSQVTQLLADNIKLRAETVWNKPYRYRCYQFVLIVDVKLAPDRGRVEADRFGVRIDPSPVNIRSWVNALQVADRWSSNDPADRTNPGASSSETTWAEGEQTSRSTFAHEIGHILGLGDTYVEGTWEPKRGAPSDLMSGHGTDIDQSNIDRMIERNRDRLFDNSKPPNQLELKDLTCEAQFVVKLHGFSDEYSATNVMNSKATPPCSHAAIDASTLQTLDVDSTAPVEVRLVEDAAVAPLGYVLEPVFDAINAVNGLTGGRNPQAAGMFDVPIDVTVSRINSKPATRDIPEPRDVASPGCTAGGTPQRPDCGQRRYQAYLAIARNAAGEVWLEHSSLPTLLRDLGYSEPRFDLLYRGCTGPIPWPAEFATQPGTVIVRAKLPALDAFKKLWSDWELEGTAGKLEIDGKADRDVSQIGLYEQAGIVFFLTFCPMNSKGDVAPGCT